MDNHGSTGAWLNTDIGTYVIHRYDWNTCEAEGMNVRYDVDKCYVIPSAQKLVRLTYYGSPSNMTYIMIVDSRNSRTYSLRYKNTVRTFIQQLYLLTWHNFAGVVAICETRYNATSPRLSRVCLVAWKHHISCI